MRWSKFLFSSKPNRKCSAFKSLWKYPFSWSFSTLFNISRPNLATSSSGNGPASFTISFTEIPNFCMMIQLLSPQCFHESIVGNPYSPLSLFSTYTSTSMHYLLSLQSFITLSAVFCSVVKLMTLQVDPFPTTEERWRISWSSIFFLLIISMI